MVGHEWPHPINSKILSFFGIYLYAKNLRHCFVPEILMTKESCNLIGPEHILINNLKFYVTHETLLFPMTTFNLSFWSNVALPTKFIHAKSRQVWAWLGMLSYTQPIVVILHAIFLGNYLDVDDKRILQSWWMRINLVYDLKLCLLNWWKNTFVYLELIHLLFWSISNLAMPLVLPKRTHGKSRKVLARLGMHGHEMM